MFVKYPRTPHLSYSPGKTAGDKLLENEDCFKGKNVVVLEKLDGENTTITSKHCYAKSLDSIAHWSRDHVVRLQGNIAPLLPETLRLHGENVYATHTIAYKGLPDYYFLFGASQDEVFLSWEEVLKIASEYYFFYPKVIYQGKYDKGLIQSAWAQYKQEPLYCKEPEGYVIRNTESFLLDEFRENVAKYVRQNYVQVDQHWMFKNQKQNLLRS